MTSLRTLANEFGAYFGEPPIPRIDTVDTPAARLHPSTVAACKQQLERDLEAGDISQADFDDAMESLK